MSYGVTSTGIPIFLGGFRSLRTDGFYKHNCLITEGWHGGRGRDRDVPRVTSLDRAFNRRPVELPRGRGGLRARMHSVARPEHEDSLQSRLRLKYKPSGAFNSFKPRRPLLGILLYNSRNFLFIYFFTTLILWWWRQGKSVFFIYFFF